MKLIEFQGSLSFAPSPRLEKGGENIFCRVPGCAALNTSLFGIFSASFQDLFSHVLVANAPRGLHLGERDPGTRSQALPTNKHRLLNLSSSSKGLQRDSNGLKF